MVLKDSSHFPDSQTAWGVPSQSQEAGRLGSSMWVSLGCHYTAVPGALAESWIRSRAASVGTASWKVNTVSHCAMGSLGSMLGKIIDFSPNRPPCPMLCHNLGHFHTAHCYTGHRGTPKSHKEEENFLSEPLLISPSLIP